MSSQGEVALILDYDPKTEQVYCTSYKNLDDTTPYTLQEAYLLASDDPSLSAKIQSSLLSNTSVFVSPNG